MDLATIIGKTNAAIKQEKVHDAHYVFALDSGGDDDLIDMTAHSEEGLNRFIGPKCIQVYVLKMITHKIEKDLCVYAIITNFCKIALY